MKNYKGTPSSTYSGSVISRKRSWLNIFLVAIAVFLVTATEVMPIGLLPDIAHGFSISSGTAGQSIFYYGIVAGISAPILTSITRLQDRRTIIIIILSVFAIGNGLCAVSTRYWEFLVSRFVIGILHGLLWAIVGNTALKIAPKGSEVRATTVVFSGISLATVLGVPAGLIIRSAFGWRSAFSALAISCALLIAAISIFMPKIGIGEKSTANKLSIIFHNRRLLIGLVTTLLFIIGYYSSYTYLRPIMSDVARIHPTYTSAVLVFFGIAGVVGNFIGGIAIEKIRASITLFYFSIICALVLLFTSVLHVSSSISIIGILVWGAAYSVLPIALQTFVLQSTTTTRDVASSMYVFIFNIAIGCGALIGGLILDHSGLITVVIFSTISMLLGTLCIGSYRVTFILQGRKFIETYE